MRCIFQKQTQDDNSRRLDYTHKEQVSITVNRYHNKKRELLQFYPEKIDSENEQEHTDKKTGQVTVNVAPQYTVTEPKGEEPGREKFWRVTSVKFLNPEQIATLILILGREGTGVHSLPELCAQLSISLFLLLS